MYNKPVAILTGVLLLIGFTFVVWYGLDRLEPHADWLSVETVAKVQAGGVLPIRVKILPQKQPCKMSIDLHWAIQRGKSQGYLISGGTVSVGSEGGSFDFNIKVPPKNGLNYVWAVIFLSPNGSWLNHTLLARTDLIPVKVTNGQSELIPVKVFGTEEVKKTSLKQKPHWLPQLVTALLFFGAGGLWHKSKPPSAGSIHPEITPRLWGILSLALLCAGLWELFGLEIVLGHKARTLAKALEFYGSRYSFQKIVVSVVAAGSTLFLVWMIKFRPVYPFWMSCFGIYLGIAFVNLLSLHALDAIAGLSWQGVTFVQALKLGFAGIITFGMFRSLYPRQLK